MSESKLTIVEVFDNNTGEIKSTKEILEYPEGGEVFEERRRVEEAIAEKSPLYSCVYCHQPVMIRGKQGGYKTLHFAHMKDSDDCPIKTGQNYSKEEILRLKYGGRKESRLHKEGKARLVDGLEMTDGVSDIKVEKNLKSLKALDKWKRPDVRCAYHDKKLVFEYQLSTTFLSVILERDQFYKENKRYLIWVFRDFKVEIENRRFTDSDVFYGHNRNAFVLDDQALEKTYEEGELHFTCFYEKPTLNEYDGGIEVNMHSALVSLSDLIYDQDFGVYYFDFNSEKERLEVRQKEILQEIHVRILKEEIQRVMGLEYAHLMKPKEVKSYFSWLSEKSSREVELSRKIVNQNADSILKAYDVVWSKKKTEAQEEFLFHKRMVEKGILDFDISDIEDGEVYSFDLLDGQAWETIGYKVRLMHLIGETDDIRHFFKKTNNWVGEIRSAINLDKNARYTEIIELLEKNSKLDMYIDFDGNPQTLIRTNSSSRKKKLLNEYKMEVVEILNNKGIEVHSNIGVKFKIDSSRETRTFIDGVIKDEETLFLLDLKINPEDFNEYSLLKHYRLLSYCRPEMRVVPIVIYKSIDGWGLSQSHIEEAENRQSVIELFEMYLEFRIYESLD